jgi:glycine oxidase
MATSENITREQAAYEVVVVGAGVIGLSLGWRAARRGLRTLVLDAESPGGGASGVAAGMLAPVTEATFGEESLLALNLEAARSYPDFVTELESETGVPVYYRASGTLAVALDRDDAELLKRLHAFQVSLGLDAEWLPGRECRRLEPGLAPSVVGGIRSSLDHQVDPRALSRALTDALARSGGELRADSPVTAILSGPEGASGVALRTGERISAEWVVVAAGWRSGTIEGLPDDAHVPVRPVKGQILRLRGDAGSPVAQRVVRTTEVYIVPREDGELVVGATVEERGPDTSVTAGGIFQLLRAAYEALPAITELELVEATAGLRPASPDNAPIVGPGAVPGLVWATAHWRNGILLAPITAEGVVELLTGGAVPEVLAAFAPGRFAREEAMVGQEASS